ncbi:MAG: TetR/AcrR family transcriptional regulator [Treponema sp.]|jgi:AcrR family transcriptional regulator|nr:TetR/AcrR family transcriptional regulator [Treponema sp.]
MNNEQRRTIIKTAYRLFLEYGYDKLTTRVLADACGMQRSLLSHYFDKKENILLAVYLDIIREIENYCRLTLSEKQIQTLDVIMVFHMFFRMMDADPRYKNIYMPVYMDPRILNRALCFAVDNNDFFGMPAITEQKKISMFIISGSMSQLMLLCENGRLNMNIRNLINFAMEGYYLHLGFGPKKTQKIVAQVNKILTKSYVLRFIVYYEKKMLN